MRVIGTVTHDADQTTTTNMLSRVAMLRPEIMTSAGITLFEDSISPMSSLMARLGLINPGLHADMPSNGRYRVVGNRKVMWQAKGPSNRKGIIVSNTGGSTPGLNQAEFTVVVNIDYFSKNDNLELEDQDTLLFVLSKNKTADGNCAYRVRLSDNKPGAFCDPSLITAGREIGFGHTAFPELSTDAGEKSTYGEWNAEWIGIQRMKHTISGTANASKVWVEHNGVRLWDYQQNIDMMKRWARAHEHALIFGKSTVDANDHVYVQDDEGRDIIQGNGLIAQGDASMRFHYNKLTIRQIDNVIDEIVMMGGESGVKDLIMCAGMHFYGEVQRLFRDTLQMNPTPLVEKTADGLEIDTTFGYYNWNGIRLHLCRNMAFSDPTRPQGRDSQGNSLASQRAFFIGAGSTKTGDPNVELITLGNSEGDRRFVAREIVGMTGDGPAVGSGSDRMMVKMASNPVDGKQVHVLSETGVIMRDPFLFGQMIKSRKA